MTTYRTRSQLLKVKSWAALVERIEAHNKAKGEPSHYFDTRTIAHWQNVWHGVPVTTPNLADSPLYFVESGTDATGDEPRAYQVKSVDASGRVETISEYPHYATEAEAIAARNAVAGVA